MKKYVIGIDYGTLSARAVLIELDSGCEIAESVYEYPHAVMTYADFGISTNADTALQHPSDYIDALSFTVREITEKASVDAKDILGIGIDFTSSTIMPVLSDGTPMCLIEKYKNNPHAYVKLWKHHGANKEADDMTQAAIKCNQSWLSDFGGKVSSEWMLPKILETKRNSAELYNETCRFIEAGEWVATTLTGSDFRSSCMAGYKTQWIKDKGYPSKGFFAEFGEDFSDIIGTKISENVLPTGSKAGEVCERGNKLCGLAEGTAVSVPIIDAHATLPGSGVVESGKLMLIVGTSCCHIILSEKDRKIDGIFGKVLDGVIPGYYAYEAGQSCVGDMFDHFIKNYVPEKYSVEAREAGINLFDLLTERASRLEVGENKLLALDWWTGNRSPYSDFDLSGVIVGLTLSTKSEDIFRALLESCAFGTKVIVDNFEKSGIEVNELYACGGIAKKNPLFMQIMADVLGKSVRVTGEEQAAAKGSAILAAYACGYYNTIKDAANKMCNSKDTIFTPVSSHHEKYKLLYEEYRTLSEYFARSGNNVMKKLKNL